ncbi:hypothetical protein QJS10_CPA06g01099 [Acorus calamus]|uniref:Uncharacterized protein n=1 Tax=Acorus calamus TaxID=4465 RepID=A0AAV9EKW2_ACOCL|nr:hypothetical protein QJS10_CPA06g01099 [Acorus calamus]
MDVVSRRLQGWKGRMLSMAGRSILIQSVINALPQHFMLSVAMPLSAVKDVEQAARSFLWNGADLLPKIHLLSWEAVTRAKAHGGLGLRQLSAMREAMLGVIAFKYLINSSDISSYFALKYKWNGNPWELGNFCKASLVWKALSQVQVKQVGARMVQPQFPHVCETSMSWLNIRGGMWNSSPLPSPPQQILMPLTGIFFITDGGVDIPNRGAGAGFVALDAPGPLQIQDILEEIHEWKRLTNCLQVSKVPRDLVAAPEALAKYARGTVESSYHTLDELWEDWVKSYTLKDKSSSNRSWLKKKTEVAVAGPQEEEKPSMK